jgi:F-type H+-transporting ATPase subunit a
MKNFLSLSWLLAILCYPLWVGAASDANQANGDQGAEPFDVEAMILNHINDANEFHLVGDISIPLPCFLYSKDQGLEVFMSSVFHHGHSAYNRYVSYHGRVKRIVDTSFPMGEVAIEGVHYDKSQDGYYLMYEDKRYEVEGASTLVGFTSYFDFSITKNVLTLLMVMVLMIWLFNGIASSYKQRVGLAPKGKQSFFEPIIVFIIEDVCKSLLGDKWLKYTPFLLTLFFFIWFINLLGLVPFFPGSANVTGNIGVTMTLALITFFVTNLNGNKHYWQHIFWMPNVPVPVKLFLAPIELIGLFTKPVSLMIRLFANITAGHIIILSLIGMIFVFGNAGESLGGAIGGIGLGIPFAAFMNVIEVIVGLIQAFIFTILTASYIGAAIEEAHH